MTDKDDYSILERAQYAFAKLESELLSTIPDIGGDSNIAQAQICARLSWAQNFILGNDTNHLPASCQAINDTISLPTNLPRDTQCPRQR